VKILINQARKLILQSSFLGGLLLLLYGCADSDLMVRHHECAPWCRVQVADVGDANLRDVWGDGKHFWIIGQGGIVVHYDGAAWRASRAYSHDLNAIAGDRKGQIFAVGEEGTVLKWDNGQFYKLPTPQYSQYSFTDVTANAYGTWIIGHSSDSSQPEVVVVHLKDGQFQTIWQPLKQSLAPFFTGVCVTDKGRVFIMGGSGGEPEPLLLSGTVHLEVMPEGLTELPSGCASYGGTVAVIDREGMDVTLIMEDETRNIGANVAASKGQSIFQAGAKSAMWLSSEHSGFAVADAIVVFDDDGYESFSSPGLLNDVHGNAPNNVYAVGESGLMMQYNGTQWHTIRNSGTTLWAIWVTAQHVVAIGDEGTILMIKENKL
jgi:hypothetical protein